MALMHGPTYGYGPIPFMAMAHSIHGHGVFHLWPWPYSIHGHNPIPFMAKSLIHGQGSVAGVPYNCTWQNVAIYPESHSPGVTPT